MVHDQETVAAPVLKAVSAWGVVAITSWADVAAMLAAFYTVLLIGEWFWKKFGRPAAESRGWIKRTKRRKEDD